MKNYIIVPLLLVLFGVTISSCQKDANSIPVSASVSQHPDFGQYWYAGVAEIGSFNLKQVRYGEVHEGKAVLIFVTEPFSKSKQVKLDYPQKNKDDEQTVLKLNFTKKFTTGIYPYSMMLSAFTPVEQGQYPNTPKVTMSSQEWCGHVFSQLNLQKNKYELSSYSYFEQEGDVSMDLEKGLLEDEIWNKIRLNPESLPVGEIDIIPGLFHTRLLHKNLKPIKAQASISNTENTSTYTLDYPENNRSLSITFNTQFPYQITGWKEAVTGRNGQKMTTEASLDKTLLTDYWSKNSVGDGYLRDSLNLN